MKILQAIGVGPDRIISSNPVKSMKFLTMASSYGVNFFSFDSDEEVKKLSRYAPGSYVYIRLIVPNEGSEWPLSKKFGVELGDALRLLLYAKDMGLNSVGITFHVGSQCTNVLNWEKALDKAKVLWDHAAEKGLRLSVLNIGGGYPIYYTRQVPDINSINVFVDKLIYERFPSDIKVFIEPGRAIVGDAGIFVATVIGKTRRGDENWLYLDVGVFNGLMESIGGIRYSYFIDRQQSQPLQQWTIAGPSCDSFDVIDRGVELSEPDVGEKVFILSSGAYTISYASEFNGFSIPRTYLI